MTPYTINGFCFFSTSVATSAERNCPAAREKTVREPCTQAGVLPFKVHCPRRRSVRARNDPRGPSGTQVRPFSGDAAASTPSSVRALCMIACFRRSDHVFVKEESFSQTPEAKAMSRCGDNATAAVSPFKTRPTRRRFNTLTVMIERGLNPMPLSLI